MGREKFAKKFKFHDEEMTEFEKAVNDHFITLGRKTLAERYKLNPLEMDRLKSFIKRLSELEDGKTKRQIALCGVSCFVLIVLTHGDMGKVYGSDGQPVDLHDIYNQFNSDNCSELVDKPKMFWISACRGRGLDAKTDGATPHMRPAVSDYRKVNQQLIPRLADMIVAYSTSAGLVSIRYPTEGTIFIQKACAVLDDFWEETDVLTMSIEINDRVARAEHKLEDDKGRKVDTVQMSNFYHSLRKKFMLSNNK